jgi:hypothetical protein
VLGSIDPGQRVQTCKLERKSYLGHVNSWSPETWLHWLRSQAESSGMTAYRPSAPWPALYGDPALRGSSIGGLGDLFPGNAS